MASSLVNLRPYQKQAIADVRAALERSGSVVLQMPTGSGKTVTAAEFIRQESAKGPVWFICHRREIIRQASKAFSALGISHDVIAPKPEEMGLGFGYSPGARVKIASVQTLSRRSIENYDAPRLAFWDECHRAAAKTWSSIIKALPNTLHVGLTATPERLDGKGLSDLFSDLVCGPSIQALIDATPPALSRVRIFAPTQPDLTKARIQMGDYRKEDADAIMNTPVIIGDAVSEYRRHADGSRALVFATSVAASKNIAAKFNSEGIPAAHIDGDTPADERDTAVSDLGAGRIKVLSNVEVFTEGVDVPEVDTVILLRPTRSLALYLQMVGRGMRPADGKDRLTVFDHAGLVYEHGLPAYEWQWSLEGGARKRRIVAAREASERQRKCPECSHVHPIAPACDECGYEYPSGREVGEHDGLLRELTGSLLGMARSEFSRFLPCSDVWVSRLIDAKGMPVLADGSIDPDEAVRWLSERNMMPKGHRYRHPRDVPNPEAYVSQAEFRRLIGGGSKNTMDQLGRAGLLASNGWVHKEPAIAWLRENWTEPRFLPPVFSTGFLSKKDFCAQYGYAPATTTKFAKEGMPTAPNGWVHVEPALAWIKERLPTEFPPQDEENPGDHERLADFGRRLRLPRPQVPKSIRHGVPRASNGWVHIRKGLEWVRDNTNIAIPPEAWPKDDGGEDA